MYVFSTKQQQIPDATITTSPEEEMIDSVEDPTMSSCDDNDNEHAKKSKIRRVTFSKEVKIETYNSPYCNPTFMVS